MNAAMELYSTAGLSPNVGLEEAVFRGLPPDNGLYMPKDLMPLPSRFWQNIGSYSLPAIAYEISRQILRESIPGPRLKALIEQSMDFDAPVHHLDDSTGILELFHGPSMAFKDFGARFMAAIMSHFLQGKQQEIYILVATSGDTGGAVAQGFFQSPGIHVRILYPKGKVSDIQEKQLTTLGGNVQALEVEGTFDDCQALVKQAFLDPDLTQHLHLASANSINISRLIPQSFYYAYALAQIRKQGESRPLVFSVPSGNFGNLSAGLLAHALGMPVQHFIAANNNNQVVKDYLDSGEYRPKPSLETLSNAMDVGNPSNFVRMQLLAGGAWEKVRQKIKGYACDDPSTLAEIQALYQDHQYLACPHTAVGMYGLKQYRAQGAPEHYGLVLATAHYAKFLPTMEACLQQSLPIPERLAKLLDKTKVARPMSTRYADFKSYLLEGRS